MKFVIALLAGLGLALPCFVAATATAESAHDHGPHDHHHHDQDEQNTTLTPAAVAAAGIVTASAGPAELRQTLTLHGRIAPTSDGVMRVAAPFAGIVESMAVEVGDRVEQGALLATVRNSESLQRYSVRAPRAGVVTERHAAPGNATDGQPLLTLADLAQVWAMVAAFPADLAQLQAGQPAMLASPFGTAGEVTASVDHIAPVTTAGQATAVRIALPNPAGQWRPGAAVTATITVAQAPLSLAVPTAAVQRLEEIPVVFVREGNRFAARPVTLGRRDGRVVEIVAGLQPGEEYVVANSFVVKADLLKSGAGHAH